MLDLSIWGCALRQANASPPPQEVPGDTLGPELLVNGDASDPSGAPWVFDGDTGAGITSVSGGQFVATDPEEYGVGGIQQQGLPLDNGANYRLTYTVVQGGGIVGLVGGGFGTVRSEPGTYSENIVSGGGDGMALSYSGIAGSTLIIDNISLKKVL